MLCAGLDERERERQTDRQTDREQRDRERERERKRGRERERAASNFFHLSPHVSQNESERWRVRGWGGVGDWWHITFHLSPHVSQNQIQGTFVLKKGGAQI
jgi:hypothetical protein